MVMSSVINSSFIKPLFLIGAIVCILTFTAPLAFAQEPPSSTITSNTTLSTPSQSPHGASIAIHDFSHALSCIVVGQSPFAPCLEYRTYKDAQGMVKSIPILSSVNTNHGIFGLSISLIGTVVSTQPISGSEFIADLGKQIGLVSEVNAQVGGAGSGVLSPIFKLWEVSRNIAYLVMILIFVTVGLMVMFRQKLNPQTVVSVQIALPGLVIGLVMITFSYFLAALISDIAFVGTNLVGYYFSLAQGSAPQIGSPLINSTTHQEENILSIFSRFTGIIGYSDAYSALSSVTGNLNGNAQFVLRMFSGFVTAQFIQPIAGAIPPPWGLFASPLITIVTGVLGSVSPEGIFALVIYFVAVFILIYSMFKLLFKLISNLLNIIFLTITSPFYFLFASLPGRQGIATAWFFNMLCHVLSFPAVVAVFYFVAYILKGVHPDSVYAPFTIANSVSVTSVSTFPLLGGLDLSILNLLIAFGALVASPSIPDIICKAIGQLGPAGQMFGSEVQGNLRSGQGYYNQQQGAMSSASGGVKRGILGEQNYHYEGGKGWVPWYGKPGLIHAKQGWDWNPFKKSGGGAIGT